MPLLVTAATGPELAAALPPLRGRPLPEQQTLALTWHGRPLLACVSGVGPVNAALALGLALGGHADIDGVLNVGLAGAFSLTELPLGTVALVTEEIFPEYGLCGADGLSDGPALGFAQWTPAAAAPVFTRLRLPHCAEPDCVGSACVKPNCAEPDYVGPDCADILGLRLPAGIPRVASLTVSGVSAAPERAAALRAAHHAALENMEGFAVALACARHALPCAELRCVSNLVGPRAAGTYDFSGALRAMEAVIPEIFNV